MFGKLGKVVESAGRGGRPTDDLVGRRRGL